MVLMNILPDGMGIGPMARVGSLMSDSRFTVAAQRSAQACVARLLNAGAVACISWDKVYRELQPGILAHAPVSRQHRKGPE